MFRPCCVALIALLAIARPASAGDPTRVWRTIESDHFVVHYYEPLGDVARRVAVVAERAHRELVPVLGNAPAEKTQVVILDNTDGANGFASVLPRNQITLFATAPTGGSVLADHDDWLYILFTHEYTHILHLDTIGGLPALYNRVFGKTWSPNQIMPRWVIEGLATYEESKHSAGGRTRNAQFDMYLRVPVLAGQELRLDEVTGAPLKFPRGNAAYLYGSHFLRYVFDRAGDDTVRAMSHGAGSSTVPFAVNRQLADVTGDSFDALYGQWRRHLRDRATLQLEAVERRGPRVGRRLTVVGENARNPRYARDGRELYWLESDGVRRTWIRAMPLDSHGGRARDVRAIDRVGTFDVGPEGALVYEQNQSYRDAYSFQDLYWWDPIADRVQRLTRGERARDPALAPDGDRVAYSRNGGSRSELVVLDRRHPEQHTVVWGGAGRFDQVLAPAWSPDGQRLAMIAWRAGGWRDVLVVAAEGGEAIEVTRDRALDDNPVWSPDGRWLYFTSDRTGISNVFAWDTASGKTWQVTNVIGGVTEIGVSPDGTRLAYGDFVGSGWDLYELRLDPRTWAPARPYVDDRPDPTTVPDDESPVTPPRPYRAIESMAPRAWTAQLATGQAGPTLSIQAGAGDSAGLHGYNLGVTLGLEHGDLTVGAAYAYAGLRPGVRVAAARAFNRRNSFRVDGVPRRWDEEVLSLTAGLSLPVRRNESTNLTMSLDYDFDWFRRVSGPEVFVEPDQYLPGVPLSNFRTAGMVVRASYGSTRGTLYGLGPTEGMEASATLRADHPALGASYRQLIVTWFWRGYVRLPWGSSTIASLRLVGGMRASDLARGPAFALGGVPRQDVADAIIRSARVSPTGYLRGYEPRVVDGNTFQMANFEYRHQLWTIEHGASTLPVYVRRLHAALLVDAGTAYDDRLTADDVRVSAGAAVRLDAFFGYFVPGTLELGYAHGLASDGISEAWLLVTSSL